MRKQRHQQEPSDDLALGFLDAAACPRAPCTFNDMGNFMHLGDESSQGDVTKSADRSQGPPILKVVRNRRPAGICISRPELYPQKVFGG